MSLSKKIQQIIEDNPLQPFNSTGVLYALLGEKVKEILPNDKRRYLAKIRTELKRLSERKKIRKISRGFYQAKPLPHIIQKLEDPEIKIHGLKLESDIVENNKNEILPSSSQNNTIEGWLNQRDFESFGYNKWKTNRWWENRKITFSVHVGGLVEIWTKASTNPYSFSDFIRWLEWVNGFFDPLLFNHSKTFVRQIGFNRDFKLLRIDGAKSVSLKLMMNVWSQIYQKGEFVRFEHHLTFPKMTLSLDNVVNSLLLINTPLSNGNDDLKDRGGMFG